MFVASLLKKYIEEVIQVCTGTLCPNQALESAIAKVPHISAGSPDMTIFICREMKQRVQDGFRILLPDADMVWVFRGKLKLFCISAFPKSHCHIHLILDLWGNPNKGNLSVNDITNREASMESMQFDHAFP